MGPSTPGTGAMGWGSPVRLSGLVGLGLHAGVARRAVRLRDRAWWRANTERVQHEQLRRLLGRAAATEFGREHGFARLASIADHGERLRAYRAAVPIADWYAFRDRLARMREQGERNVLWPGLVRDFAQTSGTTAGDKFIPVSAEMMASNRRASLDIFAHLIGRGVSPARMMSGRCLFLGGSSDVRANEHGVRTGDLSGLVTRLIGWPLSTVYAPGREIALIGDWHRKIEAMAAATIDADIRFISGMPSWACVLFERLLAMSAERGRPVRRIADLWPRAEVFVHGGVRYQPFRPRVSELMFGDAQADFAQRVELYPASEAFVAIQDEPSPGSAHPPLRLCADIGNFAEFVPLSEAGRPDAPAFTSAEVEPGERYVVVLTTCAGLWRYLLGDVVVFDEAPARMDGSGGWTSAALGGGPGGPARLRIVGRHRHFINAFGENLIVEHIEDGVIDAATATGLGGRLGEFTAAPVYPAPGRRAGLELIIEWQPAPDPDAVRRFGEAFDRAVSARNVDYTTKRSDDLGMAPPTITPVPAGTFHAWMDARGKLGGQHKCPRCANHRDYADAIRALAGLTDATAKGDQP